MEAIVVNITLPTSWQALTQPQLRYVLFLLSVGYRLDEAKTCCLLRWGKLRVLSRYGKNAFLVKHHQVTFPITAQKLVGLLAPLAWLDTSPAFPVRLAKIRQGRALPADFQGVAFEKFLYLDNLFQGYLHTQQEELLSQMGCMLYQCRKLTFKPLEILNIIFWFHALKTLFARTFPHFLRPIGEVQAGNLIGQPLATQLMDAMNAQLRALTKGDITKEHEVRKLDTWRALTELDALAKEAQELKRIYDKH